MFIIFIERKCDSPVKSTMNPVNEKSNEIVAPAITSTKTFTGSYWKEFSFI
jgi:hypothetical protein